jgi:signal transduction histidine kinase/CheY-like chemotaxis protein
MAAPPSFWFERVHKEDAARVRRAFAAIGKRGYAADYRWRRKDGRWMWITSHASARVNAEGIEIAEGTFADITEHKRLEEQVRQSQKMEAVGQLTGGIAHDFNNILAVILGNAEFLMESLSEADPRRTDAEAILEAGQRAAGLTRQLLAFSRRQVIQPRALNLNDIVSGVEKMLHRVIGEDIQLTCSLGADLGIVRADPGQIEQVIMNLVVNARDAMPVGGKLSIETANVELDEENAASRGTSRPFVMLAISDTGCGMDAETKRRLFEPFFTTKGIGKGTGLGLSTCYGIVAQSGGRIGVYSELGQGSVFKVYLPSIQVEAAQSARTATAAPTLTGHETVLLVEDDQQVRATVRRVLVGLGYDILEARDGDEAAAMSLCHQGRIDMVLSDVIIPGCNGPDVVKRIHATDDRVRALFMSGYTDHAVLRDQMLQKGMNFIQKPFTPVAIARKVREVLDAPHA